MKRLSAVLIVSALAFYAATAFAQVGANGVPAQNQNAQRIGGLDQSGNTDAARTNGSGALKVSVVNRAADDNGLQSMLAMGGLQGVTPGGSIVSTSYIPMKQFVGGSLQIDWADSLQNTQSADSVAFEVFLIGKRSTTNDGLDYFIDMDPTTSRLDGILVCHPRNGWAASTLSKSTIFAPTAILGAAAANDIQRYSVSRPLYDRLGAPISEEYIGCIVVNRSGTQGGGTVNGLNIIHGLNIQIEQKAN